MNKKYRVTLTDAERAYLETLTSTGTGSAHTHTHARILLKADQSPNGPAWTDLQISSALDVSIPTIERVRRSLVTQGLDAALTRHPSRAPRQRKLDGTAEAQLIALVCSSPPTGFDRWTLTLLAERIVKLKLVESISPETIRQTLKKTNLSLG